MRIYVDGVKGHTELMNRDNIDLVFEHLKRIGQCESRSTFSRDWLGREESYYRGIQARGHKASVEAQVNLVSRLRDLGMSFSRSEEYPTLVELGHTYLRLYGELLDTLLTSAQSYAMNSDCADDRVQR
jgi:hypothetical protein